MRGEVVADLGTFVDDHVRMEHRVVPDENSFAHYREWPDRRAAADARRLGDQRQGMNPRAGPRRLVEEREGLGEIQIRVARDQAGDWKIAEWLVSKDGAGTRVLHFVRVLGIREERQLARRGVLHTSHARDLDLSVAGQFTAEGAREVLELH